MTATARTRIEIACNHPGGCGAYYLGTAGRTADEVRAYLARLGWTSRPHGKVRDRDDRCPAHGGPAEATA